MKRRLGGLLGAIGIVLLVLAGMVDPASAQTTTTVPAARAAACAWEWGGQAETTPEKCDDTGTVDLPEWLLAAAALGVFVAGAALVGAWRK